MLSVDYAFYTEVFHGRLSETEFVRQAVYASAYLDDVTMGRTSGAVDEALTERVKLALCAVADAHAKNEEIGDLASETNDGVSVTYRSTGEGASKAARLYDAAAAFLGGTGLLYRGVR